MVKEYSSRKSKVIGIKTTKNEWITIREVCLKDEESIIGVYENDADVPPTGPHIKPIVNISDIDELVGLVLTQIEAITPYNEQAEAQKTVFRRIVWDWFHRKNEPLRDVNQQQ